MLRSIRPTANSTGRAPLRRPGAVANGLAARGRGRGLVGDHPLACADQNARLSDYERSVKQAFDGIVPSLKRISALQNEVDFEARAQRLARDELGFELPQKILEDAWVSQLDMRRLFAWCVFRTYRRYCDDFNTSHPLALDSDGGFEDFLLACGFHTLDITPCADGRLAHLIRYVLRLPQSAVRRKSYAGALFDIEDSIQKWVEVEMLRFREGRPNTADAPTRYLKVVAYHYSSIDPEHQGCAAHGSDTRAAAQAGLDRLTAFRQAIENTFCCGASIDLLLIGLDTDTDAIRIHVPDSTGALDLERYVDAMQLYKAGAAMSAEKATGAIEQAIRAASPEVVPGMARFIGRLIENNFSQIAYVRGYHGSHYEDIGHAERFIGAGVGFEEIQLRNLMYFAYLNTVEEATADLDVGIKIFTGLNVARGLPVPIIVRFDYHGQVPGARERAEQHCARVSDALRARYADLADNGLLHIMQVTRDCTGSGTLEVLACTAKVEAAGGH